MNIGIKTPKRFQSNIVEPSIPEKLHLSASSIETYKTCPLKFRFNKIDKIPQNGSKPELIFGTIIHTVLQRFHKLGGELKKQEY